MINIADEYTLTIADVALPSGYGVARFEGMVVFVPGTVPGDRALTKIVKLDKRFAYGEVVRMEEASAYRQQTDGCARYGECGGCELQALAYEKQLELKQNHLEQVLKRIGGVDLTTLTVSPIVPSVDRYFYRSKIEFAFEEAHGGTVLGLTERTSAFRPSGGHVVSVDDCRLFSPVLEQMLPLVRDFVQTSNLTAYDPSTGQGTLRRLVLREAKRTGEIMVNVIAETDIDGHLNNFAGNLAASIPDVKSIYVTVGSRPRLVLGRGYINEVFADLSLRVYPFSFFQPNPKTAEELYRRMIPVAQITNSERVLGLYCGAGTLELFLASQTKEVTGIDSSGESIAAAKENATINKIENAFFVKEKVERAVARFFGKKIDTAVIDPPRAGMSREALATVKGLKAGKLVYISCNPSTLARDLKLLRPSYQPREIIPFDFFPHTGHFEVLTLLERQ